LPRLFGALIALAASRNTAMYAETEAIRIRVALITWGFSN
jgi:hypothetical protein